MSYIIAKDDVTLTKRELFRVNAREAGIARAVSKFGMSKDEFVARQLLNITDIGAALEQWNTAALAVVGTQYSVFQAAAPVTLAQNKILVIYGIGIETVPLPVSRLTVRLGSVTGNTYAEYDLESLANSDTTEGYFNEAVCIDPQIPFDVQVTCRIATGAIARVQLFNCLIEQVGPIIA